MNPRHGLSWDPKTLRQPYSEVWDSPPARRHKETLRIHPTSLSVSLGTPQRRKDSDVGCIRRVSLCRLAGGESHTSLYGCLSVFGSQERPCRGFIWYHFKRLYRGYRR